MEQPSHPQHTLADWLVLHGLSAERCTGILAAAEAHTGPEKFNRAAVRAVRQPLPADAAWEFAARAMGLGIAGAEDLAMRVLAQTATRFGPDPGGGARSFTLHDGGNGQPFVSCNYRGRAGDFMSLAHEFGHALQIIASGGAFITPVMREVFAFIAEMVVLERLALDAPDLHGKAAMVWRADSGHHFGRDRAALQAALASPGMIYDYEWNYPVARLLAIDGKRQLPPEKLRQIAVGQMAVPGLCELLGL